MAEKEQGKVQPKFDPSLSHKNPYNREVARRLGVVWKEGGKHGSGHWVKRFGGNPTHDHHGQKY